MERGGAPRHILRSDAKVVWETSDGGTDCMSAGASSSAQAFNRLLVRSGAGQFVDVYPPKFTVTPSVGIGKPFRISKCDIYVSWLPCSNVEPQNARLPCGVGEGVSRNAYIVGYARGLEDSSRHSGQSVFGPRCTSGGAQKGVAE